MPADALLVPAAVAAGWLGQACFFARFFLQWLASERARRSVVPRAFWWLSLAGSVLMSVYAMRQGAGLLLFGFAISAAIATRNLWLGERSARLDGRWGAAAAILIAGLSLWIALATESHAGSGAWLWLAVGALGQALWVSRFPVQWWLSERAGHSHFPPIFWWLSLAGNLLLLAYALHLRDTVFVLGYLPGPLLQARNLALERKSAQRA